MRDPQATEGQIVSERESIAAGKTEVELWLDKINAAKAEEREWRESAMKAADVYEASKDAKSNFNIYHANVETIVPALYNSTPIPDVRQRHETRTELAAQPQGMPMQPGEPQPNVGRDLAELTERALTTSVDLYDFDDVIEDLVRDSEVTGRGVARVRYIPERDRQDEEAQAEVVPWDRFIRGPGFSWRHVPFIAFEHDLTKDQVEKIVDDPKRMAKLTFTKSGDDGTEFGDEKEHASKHKGILKTIKVYEVWDKPSKTVIFLTPEDKAAPLSVTPDPMGLTGFFPVPKPIYKVRRTRSLVPVCPYDVYAPLIDEIDRISKRISNLVKQLIVKGGYDPKMAPDFELLRDAEDGTYVPITASEEFVNNKGRGLEDAVLHWPIEQIVKVVQALYVEREAVKQTIYEVMGIADILRGQVDPREKAAQSELKAQSGNRRMQRSQNEVARIARDIFRIKAEIMLTKFQPETLERMTGMRVTSEMMQVIRSGLRSYTIDIETDSTVRADMAKYQEEMNMFLMGMSQFGQAIAGLAPVMPQMIGPMTEVFGGFARKFNLGKQGEDALEALAVAGQQPPKQQDDGATAAAEMQAQLQAQEHEAKMREMEAQGQRESQKHQADMQLKQADLHLKAFDLETKRQMAEIDAEAKMRDVAARRETAEIAARGKEADLAHKARLANIAAKQKQQQPRPRA